ncbi:carbohydrate ABC transporter permease [Nocardioides astragali]|uniref:Carbohydrate ABC transporter permease n=1 Tax=Nocardioides astragali TaxID=1776736 RepID=A0ABW2NBI1_9ACTN|nr:sugar ABC transporter permease [Nocardioides astragali]
MTTTAQTPASGTSQGARREGDTLTAYLFVAPAMLHTLIFMLVPAGAALYFSFTEWDMISPARWVGLANYQEVLFNGDVYPDFWKSVQVTALYVVLSVPASLLTGFVTAYLIDTVRRGESFYRLAFYLPVVTAEAAVGAVWLWLYDPQFGLVNQALGVIGLEGKDWLGTPSTVVPALALIAAWQSGTCMLIFLAGLKGIPSVYYEASEVDGAGAAQRLWRITLPLLRPTTFFLTVTGLISALQVFGLVYVLFSGSPGPEGSGLTYVLHLYLAGFRNGSMGAASAMSFLLFVAILLITAVQFRLMPRDFED